MTPRSFLLTPELADHVLASSDALDGVMADLIEETAATADRGELPGVMASGTDDDRVMAGLNAALAADPRWDTVLLPLADGLTVLRKR